jgi:hypothetical protein
VWDVEVLSAFLERDEIRDLIRRSLALVSSMPSGSKICFRMKVKSGSSAAASTAALTRIQP